MGTPAPRRWPRTLVLAGGATAIGAVSHLLAGGAFHLAGALGALPVLVALAWPLTGRERGWLTILGVQLAGQQVAHVLFGLGAAPDAHAPVLPADAWLYGHVAAAVAVATWLRCAERRAWAAARRAAAALSSWCRLLVPAARPAAPAVPTPVAAVLLPRRGPLRHSVVRRGPPAPAPTRP